MALSHFIWKKEEYGVNVKILDEQHKQLIEAIDKLYQFIQEEKGKEFFPEIFERLGEYTGNHFSTEEKYFKEFNYEGAAEHIAAHEKFKTDVAEIEGRLYNEDFNAFELLAFLENWWIYHILYIDKGYTKTFNEHGLR